MNKKISVVILNWNGASLLEQFLPSVIRYSPETVADVIVADNGSTDNSLDLLRKKFPGVGIIQFEKNHGFAEGYNKALSRIETPFAVLLNSDIEVTEGWLDAPLQLLEKHPDVACVQPKICSWSDKGSFEYAGAAGGFIDKYGYPFCRGRIFSTVERDCGQYDSEAEIVWASGQTYIGIWEGLMLLFLPIRKRLICAGVSETADGAYFLRISRLSTILAEVR